MRLWHKDLISILPRQQLLSQWRECCCIARNIAVNGTPNHLLVNKILDYPMAHFSTYIDLVLLEMHKRGYKINRTAYENLIDNLNKARGYFPAGYVDYNIIIFGDWHNDRYLMQCYYNLQEKHDCGGISDDEWQKIIMRVVSCKYHIQDSDCSYVDLMKEGCLGLPCEDVKKEKRREV